MSRIVDRAERRLTLTEAALAVFAEYGYHRATVQAVAERAGVSKGSVYDYFDSKEQLLLATADLLLTTLFDEAMEVLETSPGPIGPRIEVFIQTLIGQADAWKEACLTLLQLWAELGPDKDQPLRRLFADMYGKSASRLQAAFDDAVTRGEAAPFATRAAALALIAAMDGQVLQAVIIPEEFRAALDTGLLIRWCTKIVSLIATEPGS